MEALGVQSAIAIDKCRRCLMNLKHSNTELASGISNTTLEGWSRALDYRDKETEGQFTAGH